jgi:hypothetical protein
MASAKAVLAPPTSPPAGAGEDGARTTWYTGEVVRKLSPRADAASMPTLVAVVVLVVAVAVAAAVAAVAPPEARAMAAEKAVLLGP